MDSAQVHSQFSVNIYPDVIITGKLKCCGSPFSVIQFSVWRISKICLQRHTELMIIIQLIWSLLLFFTGVIVGKREEAYRTVSIIIVGCLAAIFKISVSIKVYIIGSIKTGIVIFTAVVVIAVCVFAQQSLKSLSICGILCDTGLFTSFEQIVQIAIVTSIFGNIIAELWESAYQLILDRSFVSFSAVILHAGRSFTGKVIIWLAAA